jgi:hypothetical protein
MAGDYSKAVLRRAFKDTLASLEYRGLRMIFSALFVTAGAMALLVFFGSPEAWKDEAIARTAPMLLAFGGFPVVFLWNLIAAPARIDAERQLEIRQLKSALTPTLRLSLSPSSGFERVEYGKTVTTVSGRKQTAITQFGPIYLLIDCENISATAIERCEAFLVSVRHEMPNGEIQPLRIDALPLLWMPIDGKSYQTSIPSRGHRNLVALLRHQEKVYFHTDNLPASYIHTFSDGGIFIVSLMVCPHNAASVPFTFRLTIGGEVTSVEPVIEG